MFGGVEAARGCPGPDLGSASQPAVSFPKKRENADMRFRKLMQFACVFLAGAGCLAAQSKRRRTGRRQNAGSRGAEPPTRILPSPRPSGALRRQRRIRPRGWRTGARRCRSSRVPRPSPTRRAIPIPYMSEDHGLNWTRCSHFARGPDNPEGSVDRLRRYLLHRGQIGAGEGSERRIKSERLSHLSRLLRMGSARTRERGEPRRLVHLQSQ